MGFFHFGKEVEKQTQKQTLSIELLHRLQCKVCPLNRQVGLKHPQMKPHGTTKPVLYFLGEAPGVEEDLRGIPFIGKSGRVLKFRIPPKWLDKIRWNNVVRTRPPDNRTPTETESECCRPSVVADIEQSKPRAIFGFGAVPLKWALGESKITQWNGRRVPIEVGKHKCWYYPMLHPSYILRSRKFTPRDQDSYGSDLEFVFAFNLKQAFAQIEDLPEPVIHTKEDAKRNVKFVTGESADDLETVRSFVRRLYDEKLVGYDYETKKYRPFAKDAKLLTVALAGKDLSLAFPLDHSQAKWSNKDKEEIDKILIDFLYDAPCRKVAHNLVFEQEWSGYFFGKKSIRAQPWGDSMSQAYILDERIGAHNLDILCLQYFGLRMKSVSGGLDKNNLDNEPLPLVLSYNAIDSKYHRLLFIEQAKALREDELMETYNNHMLRVPTMALTQLKGVPVDQSTVKKFHKEYTETLERIESEIKKLPLVIRYGKKYSKAFSVSSNIDVNKILAMEGHFLETVDEPELAKIDSDVARKILEWRETNKLLSTYVKPLMLGTPTIYPDGMLHPTISTIRTVTWRTSSNGVNSQNFPKREHREVRSQVKHKFKKIVSFDYAGIQARNVAMESKDEALVDAFWHDYDIHSDWVHRIVKIYPQWIEGGVEKLQDKELFKKYRNRAKNELVFPSFFGAQPLKLSRSLGIPEATTFKLHKEFWGMFPRIKDWQDRTIENYKKTGYVTGLSGFRRRAPISINEIINSPIQSDESIIVCNAMARLSEMEEDRFQASMEVHDDLTFIWDQKDIEKNAEVVASEMTRLAFPWINVPLVVEMSIGNDWASVKEVAKFSSIQIWNHRQETQK